MGCHLESIYQELKQCRIQTQNDNSQQLWMLKKKMSPKNDGEDFFIYISKLKINKTPFKQE